MQKILRYILPFESPKAVTDKTFQDEYNEWDQPSRQIQISAITFLTAMLYVIFAFLEKSWASDQVQLLMLQLHFFIVIPSLLAISFFAYKQRYYRYVMPALAIFPLVSLTCHVMIARQLTDYAPFVPEGYLGIFWIFIVSGMTFRYALASAAVSTLIILVSASYYIDQRDAYVMYVFWVSCSFSFGFLGALIFDSSRKRIFASQQELQHQATTDPLTGLYNRNQLNSVLKKEMERGTRYQKSFGLLLVDVDFFKNINDTFGHDTGDTVLKDIANSLAQSVRKNDTLIRWGGEEFMVVAIEIDKTNLLNLCENLRKRIESQSYGSAGNITVSIGATLFQDKDSPADLLARADKALYTAKEQGRNNSVYV